MSTYTVLPGDTLPSIARALLGSPGRWRELQLYNLEALTNPEWLKPGMVLRLPPGAAIPAQSAPAPLERPRRTRAAARSAGRRHAWSRR